MMDKDSLSGIYNTATVEVVPIVTSLVSRLGDGGEADACRMLFHGDRQLTGCYQIGGLDSQVGTVGT